MATFTRSAHEIPIEAVRRNIDQLGIKYDELPHRPFWAPLFGRTEQDFKLQIAARVMAGSALTGRELTQPEKDALSQHYAQFLVTQAWDTPVVLASTLALYRGTYAKYGFPFWTPKPEKFNPKKFFLVPKHLEEPFANFAPSLWHGLRLIAWYTSCKIVIGIFFVSYSISTYVAKSAADPRLRSYQEAIQARQKQLRRPNASLPGQQTRLGFPEGQEPGQEPASPWSSTEPNTQDSQSTWSEVQSSQPEDTQSSFKDADPYVFDDASPVAPSEQQKAASQQSTQASAWDRIRSQARPTGVAQRQGSVAQNNSWGQKREEELASRAARDGASFTYSSKDEEKSYAKDQAQRDFDEMLERERRDGASGRQ